MSVVRTLIGNVKGPKGDTGSQGPQGVAGTIEIGSVQTVSYGSPASVTNSGTEEEAILDFQIPQGAPGAQVTDMSNLVLNTITDSTADYPTFAVSETGSTIFGKIRKFLSDLKNNYVSKAMMTTSTDVDTAGQAVADAKAIKSLNDSLATKASSSDLSDFETAVAANYATKTELAKTAVSYTLESNITRQSGGIYQDDTAVYINMSVKSSVAVATAATAFMTGLPSPKSNTSTPITVTVYGVNTALSAWVSANGTLQVRASANINANGEFYIVGTYPKA